MKLNLSITLMAMILTMGCTNPLIAADRPAPTTAPSEVATEPPPAEPLPANMTRIFDSKTLANWTAIPADSWTAKNGIIASLGVGRGVLYTTGQWDRYRIIFDMRHVYGNKDHQACVLVFCTAPTAGEKPLDALGGIQFQVPNAGHWDYRKGHNNGGNGEFEQMATCRLRHSRLEPRRNPRRCKNRYRENGRRPTGRQESGRGAGLQS